MWLVCPIGEETPPESIHVVPNFGREHDLTEDCWCHPVPDSDIPTILIHSPEN